MPTRNTMADPTSKSIASYVKKNAAQVKRIQKLRHGKARGRPGSRLPWAPYCRPNQLRD